ncbi:MAG: hypothetical protein JXB48_14040 [Candidatus Latescibacteria bacterium]|nr:hypothetical protein [Candidatus Latescibacterota bacterium]
MKLFSKYDIDLTEVKNKAKQYYLICLNYARTILKICIDYCTMMYNKYNKSEYPVTITPNHWDEKLQCFSKDIREIRELFFNKSIDTIQNCCSDHITIINSTIGGKAETVTIAYQLMHIFNHLSRYVDDSEIEEFKKDLIEYVAGPDYERCMDFTEGYKKLGDTMPEKKAYFFSIDIAKYILGHSNDSLPSSFPCLSSYISYGLSKNVSERLSVTECALLIASLVPKLTGATVIALSLCFGDEEYAKEIEIQIETLI